MPESSRSQESCNKDKQPVWVKPWELHAVQAQRIWTGFALFLVLGIFSLGTDTETQSVCPNSERTGHPLPFVYGGHCLSHTCRSSITQHEGRLEISVNGRVMFLVGRDPWIGWWRRTVTSRWAVVGVLGRRPVGSRGEEENSPRRWDDGVEHWHARGVGECVSCAVGSYMSYGVLGFHSKGNGESLDDFEQKRDMIWLKLFKQDL